MSFPYQDVVARIIVDCDHASIRFDDRPNLVGGDFFGSEGWQSYRILVRFDGKTAEHWSVRQAPGGSDLNFVDSAKIIEQFAAASEVAVALEWYGEGAVAFRWSLEGSSRAIKASCP